MGLFVDGGLFKKIDCMKDIFLLKDMINIVIKKLSKDKDGFFFMVEGS